MNSTFIRHVAGVLLPVMSCQLVVGCGSAGSQGSADQDAPRAEESHGAYDGKTLFRAVYFNRGPAASKLEEMWGAQHPSYTTKSPEELASMLEKAAERMTAERYSDAAVEHVRRMATQIRAEHLSGTDLQKNHGDTTSEAMIAHIEAVSPTFFGWFGEEIQSGDPVRVEAALREGAQHLMNANTALVTGGGAVAPQPNPIPTPVNGPIAPHPGPIPTPVTGPVAPHPGPIGGGADLVYIDVAIALEAVAAAAAFVVAFAAWPMPGPGGAAGAGMLRQDELAGVVARAYAR